MNTRSRPLDLATWPRRQHFEFFRHFDNPFWNLCAPVDVTEVYEASRQPEGPSFFLTTVHRSLIAANEVEEFRYRFRGDGVAVYDVIDGGSTVLRDDDTFGFSYFDFDPDFERFAASAAEVLADVKRRPLDLDPKHDHDALIHYSVIPWVAFTSFAHARRVSPEDSVPKIVFGKVHRALRPDGGTGWQMPVSVEVHHALVDGLHVGRFFERFQALLDVNDLL